MQIDRSPQPPSKLSYSERPVFTTDTLFLNVLVEGQASLYAFHGDNLLLYFFKTGTAPVKQLIFRTFHTKNGTMEDYRYRQQLATEVTCESTKNIVNNLQYTKATLSNYFTK